MATMALKHAKSARKYLAKTWPNITKSNEKAWLNLVKACKRSTQELIEVMQHATENVEKNPAIGELEGGRK